MTTGDAYPHSTDQTNPSQPSAEIETPVEELTIVSPNRPLAMSYLTKHIQEVTAAGSATEDQLARLELERLIVSTPDRGEPGYDRQEADRVNQVVQHYQEKTRVETGATPVLHGPSIAKLYANRQRWVLSGIDPESVAKLHGKFNVEAKWERASWTEQERLRAIENAREHKTKAEAELQRFISENPDSIVRLSE